MPASIVRITFAVPTVPAAHSRCGLGEVARGVPLSMSIIRSEYLDARPYDPARFREEPDEEEEEEEEDEGDTEEGDDDDENSGYSVQACPDSWSGEG